MILNGRKEKEKDEEDMEEDLKWTSFWLWFRLRHIFCEHPPEATMEVK